MYHSSRWWYIGKWSNSFYSRFEKNPEKVHIIDISTKSSSFVISKDTRREFLWHSERINAGLDSVSPWLLRMCASQSSGVFAEIYIWTLHTCHVPSVFKNALIVPVSKKSKISNAEWLPTSSTNSSSHEIVWKTSAHSSVILNAQSFWSVPVRGSPVSWWWYVYLTLHNHSASRCQYTNIIISQGCFFSSQGGTPLYMLSATSCLSQCDSR